MDDVLVVSGLTKRYGELEAVRGIDFSVAPGEIFGLIGPNGAGKTTTLRIVATILKPSSGSVTIDGLDVVGDADRVRERISYLPEEAGAYRQMRGTDYLRFMAEIFYADKGRQDEAVSLARDVTDLGERLKDKVGSYSKGMTRKLLLARSIMTRPALAILDEPTSGLDVLNAMDIRRTVRSFTADGMAVLLSSHNMLEVEFLSDRVGIIHQGRIHEVGTPADLKEKYRAASLEDVFAEVAR